MGDTVIVNGININDINDDKQLREMMEKCEEYDDRRKIRSRIKALTSGGKDDSAEPEERFEDATDVKQTSSSRRDSKSGYNTNMQGELIPLIFDQLRTSLDEAVQRNHDRKNRFETSTPSSQDAGNNKGRDEASVNVAVAAAAAEEQQQTDEAAEECLFDSGTESGEDYSRNHSFSGEFSSFMEGLRCSLEEAARRKQNGHQAGYQKPDAPAVNEINCNLIGEVTTVLAKLQAALQNSSNTVRRPSVTSDMVCNHLDMSRKEELIALINRLQSSLTQQETATSSEPSPEPKMHKELMRLRNLNSKPTSLSSSAASSIPGSPSAVTMGSLTFSVDAEKDSNLVMRVDELKKYPVTRPPHPKLTESPRNAVANPFPAAAEMKSRIPRKRQNRPHTVGVSHEELAEARRILKEQAIRTALMEEEPEKEVVAPTTPNSTSKAIFPLLKQKSLNDIYKSSPKPFKAFVSTSSASGSTSNIYNSSPKPFTSSYSQEPAKRPPPLAFKPTKSQSSASENDTSGFVSNSSSFQYSNSQDRDVQLNTTERKPSEDSLDSEDEYEEADDGTGMMQSVQMTLPAKPTEILKTYVAPQQQGLSTVLSESNVSSAELSHIIQTRPRLTRSDACNINDDPSKLLFTPAQNVQIAVHRAAINKQLTSDENGRNDADDENDDVATETSSVASIEIANTFAQQTEPKNVYRSAFVPTARGTVYNGLCKYDNRTHENNQNYINQQQPMMNGHGEKKENRYKNRSENKKRIKRANTIDIPKPMDFITYQGDSSDDESPQSPRMSYGDKLTSPEAMKICPITFKPKTDNDRKFLAFLEKHQTTIVQPAFVSTGSSTKTSNWTSRFSNLKTAFEGNKPPPLPAPPSNRTQSSVWKTRQQWEPPKPKPPNITPLGAVSVNVKKTIFESEEPAGKSGKEVPKLPWTSGVQRRCPMVKSEPQSPAPGSGVHMVTATSSALAALRKNIAPPPPPPPPHQSILKQPQRPPSPPRHQSILKQQPIAPPPPPLPQSILKKPTSIFPNIPEQKPSPPQPPPRAKHSFSTFVENMLPSPTAPPTRTTPLPWLKDDHHSVVVVDDGNSRVFSSAAKFESHLHPHKEKEKQPSAPPSRRNSLQEDGVVFQAMAKIYAGSIQENTIVPAQPPANLHVPPSITKPQRPPSPETPSSQDEPVLLTAVTKVMGMESQQRAVVNKREVRHAGDDDDTPSSNKGPLSKHSALRNLNSVLGKLSVESSDSDREKSPIARLEPSPTVEPVKPVQHVKPTVAKPPQIYDSPSPVVDHVTNIPKKQPSVDPVVNIPKKQASVEESVVRMREVATTTVPQSRQPPPSPPTRAKPPVDRPVSMLVNSESANLNVPIQKQLPRSPTLPRKSRPKSLVLRSQDQLLPPDNNVAPPTGLKSYFPKQYEARISPERANQKKREVEAYFRQETPLSRQASDGNLYRRHKKTKEEIAVDPKKLQRQRTFSDGNVDLPDDFENYDEIDQVFESLFSANTLTKNKKKKEYKGHAVVKSKSMDYEFPMSERKSPNPDGTARTHFLRRQQAWEESSAVKRVMGQSLPSHSSSTTTVKTSSATGRSQGSSGDYQVKRSAYSSVTTSQTTSSSKVGGTSARAPSSPFAKFKQMDEKSSKSVPNSPMTPQTPGAGGSGPLFKFTDQGLSRSASGVKDMLLYWCQCRTRDYKNVQIENFSTSWNNGLAFCALIHHFYPDAFDYEALDPRNRRYNFDLAFRVADEKAGIAPLLDVDDMVAMKKPDWKCVFTYVQSIYRRLKDDS